MATYIAEAKTERLTYKAYSATTYDAESEPVLATDPAATGGQILRHVSHNLSLVKDTYRPNEIRTDLQRPMGAHGSRTAPGTINGFLSPGTHQDMFAAVMRNTWVAGIALSESDLTSVAFSSVTSKATFGGGDPAALGIKPGMILNFADLSVETANNDVDFLVLGLSGSNNRDVELYPAPTTGTADTTLTLTSRGKTIINPSSSFTNYKYLFEVYNADTDLSRLFTEARIGGFDLSIPVNNNVGLNFNILGRNRSILTGASAPFFSSPTAETTTDIPTGMAGILRLNGSTLSVVTSLNMKVNLNPTAAKVQNSDGLVGAIFLDDFMMDGDFTSFLSDSTLLDAFDNETEMELFAYLPSNRTAGAPANVFYLPRIKVNSNGESDADGGKVIQCSYEAARYVGSGAGIPSTTLQITDTEVA